MSPIYWVGSPKFTAGHPAPLIALVHHRMVGTLRSTDAAFTSTDGRDRLAAPVQDAVTSLLHVAGSVAESAVGDALIAGGDARPVNIVPMAAAGESFITAGSIR